MIKTKAWNVAKCTHNIKILLLTKVVNWRLCTLFSCSIPTTEAIQSRCAVLRYSKLTDAQVLTRLLEVCEKEEVRTLYMYMYISQQTDNLEQRCFSRTKFECRNHASNAIVDSKSGAYAGRVHWLHVHPSPSETKFRSEISKRRKKVPPRYVGRKNAPSAQLQQN